MGHEPPVTGLVPKVGLTLTQALAPNRPFLRIFCLTPGLALGSAEIPEGPARIVVT